MKKCPNCKKAIPVGARRCVHCRTLVTEEGEQGSTSMGVGARDSSREFDLDRNSTSLGRPGGSANSGFNGIPDFGRNSSNDAPHHTMLGLGPIAAASASNKRNPLDMDKVPVNHTMAGMPCIGANMTQNQANEIGRVMQKDEPVKPVAVTAPKEPVIPAPKVDEDDPLAGLAGVSAAPVPSSLVDEEFIDLTAKLFGDDFASIGNEVAEEVDDGWDFDFDPVPKNDDDDIDDHANDNVTLKAEITPEMKAQLEAVVKKDIQPIKKEEPKKEDVKPVEEPKNEEKPVVDDKKEDEKSTAIVKKSSSAIDKIAMVVAIIAGILAVAWIACKPAEAALGAEIPLLAVSAVALIFDVISSKLVSKIGSYGMLAGFVIFAVAIFAVMSSSAMMADPAAGTAKMILTISAIGQLVCAFLYFNRKN